MVRHNNMIPANHFHKKWQKLVKCWFDQPMKKKRRAVKRARKQRKLAPNPTKPFRPHVRCPTVRYNAKMRIGRGFSLAAIRGCKLHPAYARSIGIAVDFRRVCKSVEQLQLEKSMLDKYKNKCILMKDVYKKPVPPKLKLISRVVSEVEKKFSAYECLRKARKGVKSPRKLKKRIEKAE